MKLPGIFDYFASVDALVAHIAAYLTAYNKNPAPFAWKKREVRGKER